MTMTDTLFGLIPAASRGQQWIADELQLVNWGGYDGLHRLRFSPTATLLCGGSGSGKSTLMDAYIALMMPHTTPFNGASNGGVTGRPRGKDQRNILSYARGKLDESRTEDGTRQRVLRGEHADTWTAIAMTWTDQAGGQFTAVRAWYVPASARALEDVIKVRATCEGPFDLRTLEPAATQRFAEAAVKATGLNTAPTDSELAARLYATLGIGAAGAGREALGLLARIQAGQQITTVDDMYKKMVLEEPETLATADAVVAHFDELAGTRQRMLTAQQQVRALGPIREQRQILDEATERLQVIDAVGSFADTSPASLWRAQRRLDLLRTVEQEWRGRLRRATDQVSQGEVLVRAAESERDALAETLRASGGDRLEAARRELGTIEGRLVEVRQRRARLDDAAGVLGEQVSSGPEFAALSKRALTALSNRNARTAVLDAYAEARAADDAAHKELTALESERAAVDTSHDNIPRQLHQARELFAQAAGLTANELPFVGELIEVATPYEPWREAFNLALGGFATTVLIDVAHLATFRAAIDSVRLPIRLRYEGVHTGQAASDGIDNRTLPGRLDYRPTPFTGWLQQRLTSKFGFVCVNSPAELAGHRMALTVNGQISAASRGAHGGHGCQNVLGFDNARSLAHLDEQIDQARARLTELGEQRARAEAAFDNFADERRAYERISELTWEQVDVAAIEAERDRWQATVAEVTSANPEIGPLQAQVAELRGRAATLREQIGRAKQECEACEESWTATVDDVDAAQGLLDAAESAKVVLTADQCAYLDQCFEPQATDDDASPTQVLASFDGALRQASARLASDRQAAADAIGGARKSLRQTFETFLERWPNPTLGTDPEESYADFDRLLLELETRGLYKLQAEWRDSLLTLSGNDLTNLDSTLARSIREIKDRIDPINRIMADLPFSDDDHRLRIDTRENHSTSRQRFRRDLRNVRAAIEKATTDADRERVYKRMARLIDRMRRTAPDFADLIDVRNHVRVSAEKISVTGEHVALYDHIGEKSGGESQELVAFIVGAALRYQLGDADAARPRYAPVFLDEALIKADAHFTKRAIGAWRGLGFQLVIGAPNDKYSAIEPHVDVEYDILKDTKGRSWPKLKVGLPEGGPAGIVEPRDGTPADEAPNVEMADVGTSEKSAV